jgi:hypothetical protein
MKIQIDLPIPTDYVETSHCVLIAWRAYKAAGLATEANVDEIAAAGKDLFERTCRQRERANARNLRRNIRENAIGADRARRMGIFCWNPIEGNQNVGRRVVLIESWSRDCDCAESTSLVAYPATTRAYAHAFDRMAEDAEGPFHLNILAPSDVPDVEVGVRDRALEAFEDGHPWAIY